MSAMNVFFIITSRIVICLCFLSACQTKAQTASEIIWDRYGVPHVYAKNTEEMYYAYGWAQMHNHANLVLRLYGQARGKAAEYWGEDFLGSDKLVQLFNLPGLARQQYGQQVDEGKRHLDAFVKGVNAYAAAHPQAIDSGMKQVLPVRAEDVLSHITRIISLVFLGGDDIEEAMREVTPGSNSYAIGPSKSASKKAMLVANPHLPWSDFFTFFEAHLNAPGFMAYGVSLIGQPVLNIAFNENLGWTHTVNTIDASDRYELTLQGEGYLLDGVVQAFQKKTVPLQVRQPDGSHRTENLELLYAKQGPVVGQKGGKAYAVRVAGMENAFFADQYHQMAKAKNRVEFEAALKRMQNPMFNVIYADREGNILYLFNGNVPKRAEGDWAFWGKPIDGRSSKYIWDSYHRYEDLPRVLNPASGFVQNANDPPWTSTYPIALKPENFPPYMSPMRPDLRAQRAVNLVKDDPSITFDELVGYKMNTGMEAADRFLDDLLEAVRQQPDTLAQRAAAVLQKWDRATNADSRGAILFARWFEQLDPRMLKTVWTMDKPVTTPDGFNDPKLVVDMLVKAAREVDSVYGSLDIAWGKVNRFKRGSYDFPANGGPGHLGIFRTMYFSAAEDRKKYAFHGDTYVAVTEFGEKPRAEVLLGYGNASQPGSKHIGDQLELLSQKKLRPALLEKTAVLQQAEKQEQIKFGGD